MARNKLMSSKNWEKSGMDKSMDKKMGEKKASCAKSAMKKKKSR